MKGIAEKYGFTFTHQCRVCGGTHTSYYKKASEKGDYVLLIRQLRGNWQLKCRNTLLAAGKEITLEEKLKTL